MDLTDQQLKELEAKHNCKFTTCHRAERNYNVPYATIKYWALKGEFQSVRYGRKIAIVVDKKFLEKVNNYKPQHRTKRSLIEAYVMSNDYRTDYISTRPVY